VVVRLLVVLCALLSSLLGKNRFLPHNLLTFIKTRLVAGYLVGLKLFQRTEQTATNVSVNQYWLF